MIFIFKCGVFIMKWYCFIFLALVCGLVYAGETDSDDVLSQRIKPVGQVTVEKQEKPLESTGKATYERFCIICHENGLAGAPKFQNQSDWQPRLTKRTLDDLLASSIKGLNAMPAKGTCIECTDEDLNAAISYMLPKP